MFTGCCYFLFYYSLNKLLYKRVKLIYKLISETKFDESMPGQTDQNDNLNLNKVENDVQQWITKRNFELDQLRQLEKYRKDYIGNVSHELKTPVFNIQGYLQTLLDGKIEDQAIKKQFLSKAYKNALRLQHIIDDLNIVDKLESGEQILDFQKLSIKNMIREAFEENSELAALKNIKLQFNSEAADEFWVNADKEHIQIVLSNLINNSIKYGKTNGYSKAGLYELENVILIEISDNGIGIGEDHLKHVFDRFYRADKSRSREQGGSGIGLSIVKHIIENHNQKIFVRSKEGFGTTFGFTLEKSK
jgi:two-component system phosphate regulon sensor histidine kinase PhoR